MYLNIGGKTYAETDSSSWLISEVAAKLVSLSAASYAEQASVDTALCRLTAVPFGDVLVVRAFGQDGAPVNSIDVSYNISMGCFVAKPSVTGKGM